MNIADQPALGPQ